MEIHQYLAANYSLRRNKRLHISFTIPLLMSAEFLVDKFGILHSYKSVGFYYCLKQLITIAWLSVFELFCYFFYQKKLFVSVCYFIKVCYSHQSDRRIGVCISHQSDFRIRVLSRTNHNTVFGYLAPITAFGCYFLVNDVMELGGRAQRMTLTINFGLF